MRLVLFILFAPIEYCFYQLFIKNQEISFFDTRIDVEKCLKSQSNTYINEYIPHCLILLYLSECRLRMSIVHSANCLGSNYSEYSRFLLTGDEQ